MAHLLSICKFYFQILLCCHRMKRCHSVWLYLSTSLLLLMPTLASLNNFPFLFLSAVLLYRATSLSPPFISFGSPHTSISSCRFYSIFAPISNLLTLFFSPYIQTLAAAPPLLLSLRWEQIWLIDPLLSLFFPNSAFNYSLVFSFCCLRFLHLFYLFFCRLIICVIDAFWVCF